MIAHPETNDIASVKMLSVRQVAELFGVHPRTIWRMADDPASVLPGPIRLSPKVVRWRLSDVQGAIQIAQERGENHA